MKGRTMSTDKKSTWQIAGEEAGGCNCAWGCPCQFNALPTHGRCEAFVGGQVRECFFGSHRPGVVKFDHRSRRPAPTHEDNGHIKMIIDDQKTQDQHRKSTRLIASRPS